MSKPRICQWSSNDTTVTNLDSGHAPPFHRGNLPAVNWAEGPISRDAARHGPVPLFDHLKNNIAQPASVQVRLVPHFSSDGTHHASASYSELSPCLVLQRARRLC